MQNDRRPSPRDDGASLGLPHVSAGARRGFVPAPQELLRVGLPTADAAAENAERRARSGALTHADLLVRDLARYLHACTASGADSAEAAEAVAALGRSVDAAAADGLGAARRRGATPVRVRVHFDDGREAVVVAFPARDGWHACPPCGSTDPVYARPTDAALAHARRSGAIPIGAEVLA